MGRVKGIRTRQSRYTKPDINTPIGFHYQTVKGHSKLLKPDEPRASTVREAIEGFAIRRYQTQAEVKRFLESKPDYPHIKDGKARDKRVTDLLTNPLYAGYVCSEVYELNWLKGQHEPLVELLSNLVFEGFGSCSGLVLFSGFNSVFEYDVSDDFVEFAKAA